jgi:hypothetical protein
VRLRGVDPTFVVTPPPSDQHWEQGATQVPMVPSMVPFDDGGGTSRINVRLPDQLKQRIEEAAGREGLSVNAWLVRAAATVLEPRPVPPVAGRGSGAADGRSFTGWVR